GSMRTTPVNQSGGPLAEGLEPGRWMSMRVSFGGHDRRGPGRWWKGDALRVRRFYAFFAPVRDYGGGPLHADLHMLSMLTMLSMLARGAGSGNGESELP